MTSDTVETSLPRRHLQFISSAVTTSSDHKSSFSSPSTCRPHCSPSQRVAFWARGWKTGLEQLNLPLNAEGISGETNLRLPLGSEIPQNPHTHPRSCWMTKLPASSSNPLIWTALSLNRFVRPSAQSARSSISWKRWKRKFWVSYGVLKFVCVIIKRANSWWRLYDGRECKSFGMVRTINHLAGKLSNLGSVSTYFLYSCNHIWIQLRRPSIQSSPAVFHSARQW